MNIAIIDDSEIEQHILSDYLKRYFTENICDTPLYIQLFNSGEEFLQSFKKDSFEIIFIDIYMEELSGLDTAKMIRSTDTRVLLFFTTFSSSHAIACYKVKASGYLLKPFSYTELEEMISLNNITTLKECQFIEFQNGVDKVAIFVNDIVYCDILGHYTQIHIKSGDMKRIRMSFFRLITLLSPFMQFLHCYRGCVINMDYIEKIDHLDILMKGGIKIPLRRREQSKIEQKYAQFLFDKTRNGEL